MYYYKCQSLPYNLKLVLILIKEVFKNSSLENFDLQQLKESHSQELESLTEQRSQLLKFFKDLRSDITKLASNL